MNSKCLLYFVCFALAYSVPGVSEEMVTCSFRDSKNVYRQFLLKKSDTNDEQFFDAQKVLGPYWKVMSNDEDKLILFKEVDRPRTGNDASVYTIFFIDKKSGDFRFRNYINTEYINTVRGECQFK